MNENKKKKKIKTNGINLAYQEGKYTDIQTKKT